jgi:CO/xanthine dehydrogenase FAD-binding subunit
MSDIAPVLISLGAQLVILDRSGEKGVDINDFYTGDGLKPLKLGSAEMITAILIPPESQQMQCHFVKATPRGGLEFAMVSVAIALSIDGPDKKCDQAHMVVGSVNTSPLRAFRAEQEIVGQRINDALASEIARIVAGEVKVLPHHGYSMGYLKQMVEVHAKRSLMAMIHPPRKQTGNKSD